MKPIELSVDKIALMYFRVCLERDAVVEKIQLLQEENAKLKGEIERGISDRGAKGSKDNKS